MYANFIELFVHKYLFHGLGKKKNSIFSFHLRDHHVEAKREKFLDYNTTSREKFGILFLAILHLPLLKFSIISYIIIWIYGISFITIHHLQHQQPAFTKKYMWWHWNHHMENPNKNWGVVLPAADYICGSLEK